MNRSRFARSRGYNGAHAVDETDLRVESKHMLYIAYTLRLRLPYILPLALSGANTDVSKHATNLPAEKNSSLPDHSSPAQEPERHAAMVASAREWRRSR